jgi:malate/lactate dehydrogenase
MSTIAILGAGPIGACVAQTLAHRARVRDVRLIDTAESVAAGKALDIRQAGPVSGCGGYDTRLTGMGDPLAAVGADVIIIADEHTAGEWAGDRGLALIRRLVAAGATSPFVFAGTQQTWLIEAVVREAGVDRDRVVGSAAAALAGAVRGLVARDVNGSGVDVAVNVCGRPPAFTVAWSSASVGGSLVTDRLPAHRLRAITQQLRALWPVGPYAIAAATAPIVEGLVSGTRRDTPGVTVLDREVGVRGAACLLPLTLGQGRVLTRLVPSLSPQERTDVLNSLS